MTVLRVAGRSVPVVGRAHGHVCGITPYDTTHLGTPPPSCGAMSRRGRCGTLAWTSRCVATSPTSTTSSTAAARAGSRFDSFAAVRQFRFDRDMAVLGVRRPHEPRAHNHVAQVVALGEALLESVPPTGDGERCGSAVRTCRPGSGWPPTASAGPGRGGELAAGGAALGDDRDDPFDVAVWRAAGLGAGTSEPAWPSPWGEGRPGWHAGALRWR